MNTMLTLALTAILLAAGCDVPADDDEPTHVAEALAPPVTGAWALSMQSDSRPFVGIQCDGHLTLTEKGIQVTGEWSCANGGSGLVRGTRMVNRMILTFYVVDAPSSGAGWLDTVTAVTATGFSGPGVSATRN